MTNKKENFLKTCIDNEILRFGEFTLKSGRISPYFFNAGLFNNGQLLGQLAANYARLIKEVVQGEFMLYGPAYKGIPLAAATAVELANRYGMCVPYAFNRKEAKDHGEGGVLVGAELQGKVIILDDVITAGTSATESVDIIKSGGADPHAIVIALDRQETVAGEDVSAVEKFQRQAGIQVHALMRLDDLVQYLESNSEFGQYRSAIVAYRDKYGCK